MENPQLPSQFLQQHAFRKPDPGAEDAESGGAFPQGRRPRFSVAPGGEAEGALPSMRLGGAEAGSTARVL